MEASVPPEICKVFYGYTLWDVFEKDAPDLRNKVVALWRRNGALPAGVDPAQRAAQAALVAIGPSGEAVGVTTVYKGDLAQLGVSGALPESCYFYRMFIQPSDRVAELMRVMTNATYDILRACNVPDKPAGMVFVSENRKLMRAGMRRKLLVHGYEFVGQNDRGQDIVLRRF